MRYERRDKKVIDKILLGNEESISVNKIRCEFKDDDKINKKKIKTIQSNPFVIKELNEDEFIEENEKRLSNKLFKESIDSSKNK